MYLYTCTKGMCTCTMYDSVQCDAYTHTCTYIHVLKVCVHVQCMMYNAYTHSVQCDVQCMIVYSVMHIHIHVLIYMY